jgi:hypothetical protein
MPPHQGAAFDAPQRAFGKLYSLTSITARPGRAAPGGAAGGQQFDVAEASARATTGRFIRHGKQGTFNGHDGFLSERPFRIFCAGCCVDAEHVGRARLVAFGAVRCKPAAAFHGAHHHVVDLSAFRRRVMK